MIGLDLVGQELNIGDRVIFTEYGNEHMKIGKIIKLTDKMVYVKDDQWQSMTRISKWEGLTTRIMKL